jgi:hypothetical protein
MAINLVLQDGIVKSLALKYDHQSRPELRFTLEQRDGEFCLWLPCCASGSAAERLAAEIEDGQHVVLTSAKLCYRKRQTKAGEVSRMEILCWSIERLSESPQVARSDVGEYPRQGDAPVRVPDGKVRRPRYPKFRGQPNPN